MMHWDMGTTSWIPDMGSNPFPLDTKHGTPSPGYQTWDLPPLVTGGHNLKPVQTCSLKDRYKPLVDCCDPVPAFRLLKNGVRLVWIVQDWHFSMDLLATFITGVIFERQSKQGISTLCLG